jgi:hypothetical protein
MAFTNRGKHLVLNGYFAGGTLQTNFYWALSTNTDPPTVDDNLISDVSEIAAGNGYSAGGQVKAANGTNFPFVESDANDRTEADPPDIVWTASGGPIPASGGAARWLLLLTGAEAAGSRQLIAYFDLGSDRTISDGQSLTLQNPLLRGS